MSTPKKIKMLNVLKRVRKIKEDLKKGELAIEQKKLQAYQDQTKYLDELRQETFSTIQENIEDSVNPNELIKYQMYLRQLHVRSVLSKESEKEQLKEIASKRTELIKANQQKTVAEKILDHQVDKYKKSLNTQENKEMDEFSSIFFQREANKNKKDS